MFSRAIVSLALAASALANVFITSPVSSTSWPAGQQATIAWQDDGNSPSLDQFGLATFAIYVGNANQQTPIQPIASNVNVSSITSLAFTPDASIGPNSSEYFIRVTSSSFKDPKSSQYFEEAFSAKFTLSGMSGTFNSSVQAEINGQSTAPIGVPTSSGSAASQSMTNLVPSVAASTVPAATASATASASTSGAGKPVIATGFVALAAMLVGTSLL